MVTKTLSKLLILASGVTNDACKNALLVHMVGQETQSIFDTLTVEECDGELYKSSLDTLHQKFYIKKIISVEWSTDKSFNRNISKGLFRLIYRVYIFWAAKQLEKKSIEQFFNCYFAASWLTLGHYQGRSLTHPMLLTAFGDTQPKGH